jgi:hypothetical protein
MKALTLSATLITALTLPMTAQASRSSTKLMEACGLAATAVCGQATGATPTTPTFPSGPSAVQAAREAASR